MSIQSLAVDNASSYLIIIIKSLSIYNHYQYLNTDSYIVQSITYVGFFICI